MNPRKLRKKLGLNQTQFWNPIGITQSGGSRYEAGREMPKPVAILIEIYWNDRFYYKRIDRIVYQLRRKS
jgi:hypothetical protein